MPTFFIMLGYLHISHPVRKKVLKICFAFGTTSSVTPPIYNNNHIFYLRCATCLVATRSRFGSDSPPDCHSLPHRRFATLRKGLKLVTSTNIEIKFAQIPLSSSGCRWRHPLQIVVLFFITKKQTGQSPVCFAVILVYLQPWSSSL